MQVAISETRRRRKYQEQYNKEHGITPKTIQKKISKEMFVGLGSKKISAHDVKNLSREQKKNLTLELTEQMEMAAQNLEFEKAAELRDQIKILKKSKK